MIDLDAAQAAIREENLGGWLFHNIFHRDEISDTILEVGRQSTNTRPWVCVVFPDRPAFKLVHTIEAGILDHVPGTSAIYSSRDEFQKALETALPRGTVVAAQFSSNFPVSSFLDLGTGRLFEDAGVRLVSSEGLIARRLGTLDERGMQSHEKAASALYEIVRTVWQRVVKTMRAGKALYETEVRGWMEALIGECRLETDSSPLVAAGRGSANPHYAPRASGSLLSLGDVVQLDIWARERQPDSVFADISWVGVIAEEPSPRFAQVFEAVVRARETAVELICSRLAQREPVSGAEVDRVVRARLAELGYASAIRHRTGHSIGRRVHGYGVNLDSVEFPDERPLRNGACFSVEPGVYLEEFGMRTEIDAYISDGRLVISGNERQARLLLLG
jgi:Xaa-Pro dipeptidase